MYVGMHSEPQRITDQLYHGFASPFYMYLDERIELTRPRWKLNSDIFPHLKINLGRTWIITCNFYQASAISCFSTLPVLPFARPERPNFDEA
jgi:hypothetical protein